MAEVGLTLRVTASALLASGLTSFLLFAVLQGTEWFIRSATAIALVAAVGAAARLVGISRFLVPVLQLTAVTVLFTTIYAPQTAYGGWLPGAATAGALQAHYELALDEINAAVPPFTPSASLIFVTAAGLALVAIAVDLLAAYRLPALAGVPLLVVYAIPALALPQGLPGWLFVLPAAGYLILLISDGGQRLRDGAQTGASSENRGRRGHGRQGRRMVRHVGLIVLGVSVALPALAPQLSAGAIGEGGLGKTGGGSIATLNPLVSLRRDLVRPEDVDVMVVRTSASRPEELYLRAITLDTFDGTEWRASRRVVKDFDSALPQPPGLASTVPAAEVQTTIEVLDTFRADYAPLPYPATRLEIDGSWRVDPRTGNVVSRTGPDQIAGRSYRVDGLELSPSPSDVRSEAPGADLEPYLSLPADLPAEVRRTAQEVVEGVAGPLAQGLALQQWFRDPANFTYDLRQQPGTGQEAILDFLDDRRGYCEQFASTMAVMARHLGIPARVNVGFTAGQPGLDKLTRIISAHDAHAWPELFLAGVGWTRFEPTPASASSTPQAPGWLTPQSPTAPSSANDNTDAANPSNEAPDSEASDSAAIPDSQPPTRPESRPELPNPVEDQPQSAAEPPSNSWVSIAGIAIALSGALTIPRLVRSGISRHRWRRARTPETRPGERAELAWSELRDRALDLGYRWPPGTPRQCAAAMARTVTLGRQDLQQLSSLTGAVERNRFAAEPHAPGAAELRSTVDDLVGALAAAVSPATRLRAALLPRSLYLRRSAGGNRWPVRPRSYRPPLVD
ncbi:transglutaminaseTgpA domain-containing protein [Sporichthya polymorpha]|uniref:transglutaminase family protein n=1 Tax=Sporichthya polymorpha TaxID=35751 RepID=UPI00036C91D0|nr:DUF3488 and transglutaminase-like domain-containing protein [Sporichthya polymorpha]